MSKEKIKKELEREENMDKMMTQIDLLSKNFMEGGFKSVDAVE